MLFFSIAQLVSENVSTEELNQVLDFCLEVGLPVCLSDIGVDKITKEELMEVAEKACIKEESIHAMPFPVTVESVAAAIIAADRIGKDYKSRKACK